jgi:hypothetical protein
MTSVPYPSFVHQRPVDTDRAALSAVGRCRIFPEFCTFASRGNSSHDDAQVEDDEDDDDGADEYLAIVAKNVLQAQVDNNSHPDDGISSDIASVTSTNTSEAREKLKKRYRKEGVAMAQRYLRDTLRIDTSIIDVEMVVRAEDLMDTQGCLASCLLDAGCHAIVTDGTHLQAMDICQIPRERLVAHFALPYFFPKGEDGSSGLIQAMQAASTLAACVSVEFMKGKAFSMESMHQITQFATSGQGDHNNNNHKVQVVLQFRPQDCCNDDMSETELAHLVGLICRKLKNHAGTVTLVDPTPRQLGLAYAACLTTDRKDELYTTVVCTRNGEALGLVYSSKVCFYYVYICCLCEPNKWKTRHDEVSSLSLTSLVCVTRWCVFYIGIHYCRTGEWSGCILFSFSQRTMAQG